MSRGLNPAWELFHSLDLPPLAGNAVTCVGLLLDEDAGACCQAARAYVNETESLRAQRFVHPIDAARHLVGRALVRRTLAAELGQDRALAEFSLNAWGKPGLNGGEIEFSISHSGRWVWAAFSHGVPVGIDIEEIRSLNDLGELMGSLHPVESAAIRRLPPCEANTAFYRCWVRKEAVIKAVGEGLSRPLDSFRVRTESVSSNWLAEFSGDSTERWTTADVAIPGEEYCSVAVAARAPGLSVITHILPDSGSRG
jgi:4'-phosphopantetheinyl transferase